jgi:hypothetical protein
MDVEDVDMATLEDILIMGPKYAVTATSGMSGAKLGMSTEER